MNIELQLKNFLDENPEFLSKFRKNEWTLFYERNIIQNLTKQHRSVRGTYTLRQKLENKEKFLYSEAKDKSSSTDADNSKLDKGANDDKGTNTNGKNADKGEDVNTDRNGKHANTDSKGGEGASIKNNKGEGIYDSDRSYNTEEEDQYLSSLFDNYELHRR
ncbi:hypothetical protein GLOIN_2v1735248 [Rhizophagus clarus]|uniref:Uncharacterized protein n=1 Tax=Rhizophagus clarus TaxID=94130 RepID=A0A8H3LCM7_9GLOM|nr:hypothetical protein GLOIN_2v1735248 [Rhizophagus clarus]